MPPARLTSHAGSNVETDRYRLQCQRPCVARRGKKASGLVLAKSIDLSWKTTRAILMLDSGVNAAEYVDRYKKLRLETARSPIQFYRLRERATKTPPR
jgi:hypothetical protein